MIKSLEKYWPSISTVLLLSALVTLFLWPTIAKPIIWTVIILGIGVAVVLTVNRQYRKNLENRYGRAQMVKNIGIDAIGVILTIGCPIYLASLVASWIVPAIVQAVESSKQGWGTPVGILSGLLVGAVVGFAVGLIVRAIWTKLMRPFLAIS
ncbi:MAG: hypothetical protein WBM17_09825 [Anaerolineales bacterium]